MAKKPDLTKLKHVYTEQPLHLYFETLEDGTNVLRHIRINQRTYEVPADGITADIPEGSVGSREIKDESVQMQDLDPKIITTVEEAHGIVADAIAKTGGKTGGEI